MHRPSRFSNRRWLVTLARMSAQARREQFVEAAIAVMSKEGLDRATTRRIRGGRRSATVFRYTFRDKNELLASVVGECDDAGGSGCCAMR